MGERKTPFVIGEFYHIYNRGNSKQIIFRSSDDYQRFLRLLKIANTDASFKLKYLNESESASSRGVPLVAIGSYCLMPNHFHILLSPLVENGLSLFMKKVATGYSMYFNNKYERTGSLFEGKFKSKWISTDNHLKYLFAYIHLNPVKLIEPGWKEEGIKDISKAYDFAVSYPYSSLTAHLSQVFPVKDGQECIIDTKPFPAFFSNNLDKRTDLFEWLAYEE